MESSILKPFNSHISVVDCSFFEFGTVSKSCIREWVNSHQVTALVKYCHCIMKASRQRNFSKIKMYMP